MAVAKQAVGSEWDIGLTSSTSAIASRCQSALVEKLSPTDIGYAAGESARAETPICRGVLVATSRMSRLYNLDHRSNCQLPGFAFAFIHIDRLNAPSL